MQDGETMFIFERYQQFEETGRTKNINKKDKNNIEPA